jgi:drug/metabolite transporter (DMT)-like permease
MGALNNVIPFGLMAWGQLHIESGLTSILNAATAVFAVLVAAALFADERLTLTKMIGTALGFAGVAVAIGVDALANFDLRSTAQIAVLAGTVSYAFAGAWARRHLAGLPPVIAAAGMLTGSTVLMVPIVLTIDGVPSIDLSARTWISMGYLTVIATAGAYLLYYRVLAAAGSGNLLIVTLLVPPVAITLGAAVLDEALPAQVYVGFSLLAAGLLVLNGTLRLPLRTGRD